MFLKQRIYVIEEENTYSSFNYMFFYAINVTDFLTWISSITLTINISIHRVKRYIFFCQICLFRAKTCRINLIICNCRSRTQSEMIMKLTSKIQCRFQYHFWLGKSLMCPSMSSIWWLFYGKLYLTLISKVYTSYHQLQKI